MWSVIGLLLFTVGIFALFTLLRKWADSFVLIAFAIGCIVNANFYNAATMPIKIGPVVFGIDSVLYTLFLFSIVIKFIHYSVKDGKIVAFSSVVAIELSAIIELCANLSYGGYKDEYIFKFIVFTISAIGSLLAIWVSAKLTKIFEKKKINRNITILVAVLAGSIVNNLIFYGAYAIFAKYLTNILVLNTSDYGWAILGGFILKLLSIGLAMLSYFVSANYFVPNEITKMILDNKTSTLVRKAEPDDAEQLRELVLLAIENRKTRMVYTETELDVIRNFYEVKNIKKIIQNESVYVVINDGELVASSCVNVYDDDKDTAYISFVYSSPKKEGKGLGKIALKACESDEICENVKIFRIHALLTTVRYYQLAGYRHINNEPTIINDGGVQCYVMTKENKETA